MKRTLLRILSFVMACIVLITSTGFGFIEHSCLMRGKKMYLAVQKDSCKGCPSEKGHSFPIDKPIIKKTDCCQEHQHFKNVNYTSSISHLVAKFIKVVTDMVIDGTVLFAEWLMGILFPLEEPEIVQVESPPLPHGRDLLAFVQSFLL
ncbi:hypothetical protein [Tellurirhabdus bombi]|uniref:hypothetical protein n=1 Tax=Tellurirhabdus bombi TaxID=2907205 RepID=UPI001F32FB3F|nr:hypothetical protein [Tellurirhabdus bombi]